MISADRILGGWGAKCGFFWLATCALCFVYSYFRLPETRNRPFVELDYLFQQRVSARKFRDYEIDTHALATVGDGQRSPVLEAVDEKKADVEQIEAAPVVTLQK